MVVVTYESYLNKYSTFSLDILCNTEYLIKWVFRKYCLHKLGNWCLLLVWLQMTTRKMSSDVFRKNLTSWNDFSHIQTLLRCWDVVQKRVCITIRFSSVFILFQINFRSKRNVMLNCECWYSLRHVLRLWTILHCISKKNIPDVFSYNSRKHWQIFTIFGRNVTEKASNHTLLYFSTSPN